MRRVQRPINPPDSFTTEQLVEAIDTITLSRKAAKRFVEALENPPEPSEPLKEAAAKYKDDVAP